MENPSLRNPNLKAARAKEHLESLKMEIETFQESKPCKIVAKRNPRKQRYNLTVTLQPAPPIMGLLIGEFVYCLRSALDQLVWQLALLTTRSPSDRSQFPIYEVNTTDTASKFSRATNDIPAQAASVIESLQPYHRGNAFKDDPLWRINKLCNIDKHKVIPVRGTQADLDIDVGGKPLAWAAGLDSAHVVVGTRSGLPQQIKFNPQPAVEVIFGESASGIELRIVNLTSMYKAVTESVIPQFIRFFP